MEPFGRQLKWIALTGLLVVSTPLSSYAQAQQLQGAATQALCAALSGAAGSGQMSSALSMLCKVDWTKLMGALGGGGSGSGSGSESSSTAATDAATQAAILQEQQQAVADWQNGLSAGRAACAAASGTISTPLNPYASQAYKLGYEEGLKNCSTTASTTTESTASTSSTSGATSTVTATNTATQAAYTPSWSYYTTGVGGGDSARSYQPSTPFYANNQPAVYHTPDFAGGGYAGSGMVIGAFSNLSGSGAGIALSGPGSMDSGAVRLNDGGGISGAAVTEDQQQQEQALWQRGVADGRIGLEPITDHPVYRNGYMRGMMLSGRVVAGI